MLQRVSGITNQ